MGENEFSGVWCCRHWFPSNTYPGEEELREYQVTVQRKGDTLVLQSLPNKEETYILVKLKIDGMAVGGSWQENTSPSSEFKGMIYSGLVQLLYDREEKCMNGMWVGIGRDHEHNKPAVYSGRWEICYVGEAPVSRIEATGFTSARK